MKKWVEIAHSSSRLRFETLSEYLSELGYENQVDFVEASTSEFSEVFQDLVQKYDMIRVGSPYGTSVIYEFETYRDQVRFLKSADALIKKDGHWSLRSATLQAIIHVLNGVGPKLLLGSDVLIVGAGAGARAVVAAFSKLGFSRFKITNKFPDQATSMIKELKEAYFDIQFEFVPQERLIMLPGVHGVCVNTTPFVSSNDLLPELYYFNFLKPEGVVIDFTLIPLVTPLIQEAQEIGIHVVHGFEVSGMADILWSEWCFGVKPDLKQYYQKLKEKIESTKVST